MPDRAVEPRRLYGPRRSALKIIVRLLSFYEGFPDAVVARLEKSLVRRFQLPNFERTDSGWSADTEEIQAGLAAVVRVRCEKSRSIVGEYFDNVLVDKYAQFEILAGGQICNCKRSLGGADAQSAGVGPQHDRETTVASTTKSVVRIL